MRFLDRIRNEERARTLTECVELVATYEAHGANAGFVRLVLAARAEEAWEKVHPLEAAEDSTPVGLSAASSGHLPQSRRLSPAVDPQVSAPNVFPFPDYSVKVPPA